MSVASLTLWCVREDVLMSTFLSITHLVRKEHSDLCKILFIFSRFRHTAKQRRRPHLQKTKELPSEGCVLASRIIIRRKIAEKERQSSI